MSLIPAFQTGVWNAWILCLAFLFVQFASIGLLNLFYDGAFKRAAAAPSTGKIDRLANVVMIIAFIYSIFLPLELGSAWFYPGVGIFLLGLFALLAASVNFASTPLEEPVTRGLYRYSRNPMYIAMFVTMIGVSVASASWVFLLSVISVIILVNFTVTGEEQFCSEKYGAAYREYLKRTPRWIGIPKR